MQRISRILAVVTMLTVCGLARADLIDTYNGFDWFRSDGTTGLVSSYYSDVAAGQTITGTTTSTSLATFGPNRVSYPNGVGEVPSPGGSLMHYFDLGAVGVKADGNDLTFQLTSGMDPETGYYTSSDNTWIGIGDLFIDVSDSAGVRHYALLSTWGTEQSGAPLTYNGGYYSDAMSFHLTGDGGSSLIGHLVKLTCNDDIMISGGTAAYNGGNAPTGLDRRIFASGGSDLGNGDLTLASLTDDGFNWYTQSWTINGSLLSQDAEYEISMHAGPTCANDQIGGNVMVPEPTSLLLLLLGAGVLLRQMR